ncbi:LysR family transcriptional regulator [Pseudomaricurvus alkylphenolicus]|jgi:DNA-binding transcriptional LysR family regulator|uniref:LysR family transcriptional regulator n=1 Tax=Pseudomaricurvus alkylphenolicus TaxID=1306991 RepID=UPI0014208AAD|nr:LysR family transcriptional regulator [Pseudomaricurvus alkylphenolicus]NIB44166.1 LysR family transcriptional regulator [Pseudomaricurvus alkylphenolicus]
MAFTFKQLRYFIAVAETGKVSDAAVAVNISASSVTEAIKDLEYYLGTELFERKRTGLDLTPEGFRFLTHATRILNDVQSARQFVHEDAQGVEGKLRIGCTITVAGYFLAGLLQRFRRAFPNVEVDIAEHSRMELETMVDKGDIDLAMLLVSNVRPSKKRNTVSLVRSQRRLWLANDHPLLEKDIVTLEDIAEQPYIQLLIDEASETTRTYWHKYKLEPRVVFKTASVEAVRSLVATGAGVTILSDMVHRPWSLEGDRINTVEVKQQIPSMDTGLMWSSKRATPDLVKRFIDFSRLQYTSGGHSR